jgi:hypothetical protein
MALTVSARTRGILPSTPNLIKGAAICAAVGIAASLSEYADFGKWLTVLGVLLLIVGLHRFGRSGPDAAIIFELPAPRKKRKRKKQAVGAEAETNANDADSANDAEPANDADSES